MLMMIIMMMLMIFMVIATTNITTLTTLTMITTITTSLSLLLMMMMTMQLLLMLMLMMMMMMMMMMTMTTTMMLMTLKKVEVMYHKTKSFQLVKVELCAVVLAFLKGVRYDASEITVEGYRCTGSNSISSKISARVNYAKNGQEEAC